MILRHDFWYHLKKWWGRYLLIIAIMSASAGGFAYSGKILEKGDSWAEKYINAKVDARMGCILTRLASTEIKLDTMTTELKKNNEYMDFMIKAYIKRGLS